MNAESKPVKINRRVICPVCNTTLIDDIEKGCKVRIICNHCKKTSILLEGTELGIKMNIWYLPVNS